MAMFTVLARACGVSADRWSATAAPTATDSIGAGLGATRGPSEDEEEDARGGAAERGGRGGAGASRRGSDARVGGRRDGREREHDGPSSLTRVVGGALLGEDSASSPMTLGGGGVVRPVAMEVY